MRCDIPWYSFREQYVLPFLLLKEKCDLVHFPHFNVPFLYPKPFCITIHDLILLKYPQSATSAASTKHPAFHWIKYQLYRFVLKCAVTRAKKIIAVSYGVKKDLIELLHVKSEKIEVVYEGVDQAILKKSGVLPTQVPTPYALYTGNAFPHKNCEGLLDVFELVKKEHYSLSLVMCGQEDFFYHRIVSEIKKRKLEEYVVHLGYVSDDLLASLYHHALCAILLSFEEGFGLTPLEAMVCKTPALVSCVSVLPEILGSAAFYVDPTCPEEIFRALKSIMYNTDLRKELITRGGKRVQKYQWEEMARHIHRIYNSFSL